MKILNKCLSPLFLLFIFFNTHLSFAENFKISIKITGLPETESQLVRDSLSINNLKTEQSSLQEIKALYQLSGQELKLKLLNLGYLLDQYNSDFKTGLDKKNNTLVFINYHIQKIRPIILGSQEILINGKPGLFLETEEINIPWQMNQRLNIGLYEKFKLELLNQALQNGYVQAYFSKNQVIINPDELKAKIILHLETGPLFYFGNIRFESKKYESAYLQKYIPFKPNSIYTPKNILKLQKNLNNSQLFSKVHAIAEWDLVQDNKIPVRVKLNDLPSNRYLFGLGYGTDTGFRTSLSWERLRQTQPGHRILSELKLSEKISTAQVRYIITGQKTLYDRIEFATRAFE
ncbi:MAG: autotransporter assembly complex protein TamA, partial [Gammaproteobacteria bacterium]